MYTWSLGYEKSKTKAKKIYSQLGRIACPSFRGEVVIFSRDGFSHLIRKGRIPRTRNEQKRRFVLLPYAKRIITNPGTTIIYGRKEFKNKVNRHGSKVVISSVADFWTFIEKIKDCIVKLVVIQTKDGQKRFISIMGDNVKIKDSKNTKKPLQK